MELHPKLNSFYTSVLAYAGLRMDQDVIVNTDEKLKGFTLDDKPLSLPYHSVLKNPAGKHIFHPLNENYANAETALFNLYRDKLTYEINLRLSSLILAIIQVASDVQLQQRAKSSKLIELIAAVQETDASSSESFVRVVKASQVKMKESFLVNFHLKKNATIDGTPYTAIGKVNFHLYRECLRALEEKDEYRVYGCKIRKKDLMSFIDIFQAIFKDIDNTEHFTIGTDHKPFRMFNALLLVTHQIASVINETAALLEEVNEASLSLETCVSDLGWGSDLEDVYSLTNEIRMIPNQTNLEVQSHQLKLKEPKQIEQLTTTGPIPAPAPLVQPATPAPALPAYVPPWVQTPTAPPGYQQQMQPAPQAAPSPEDIIRNAATQRGMMQQQAFMQQGFQPAYMNQPGYPQFNQGYPQQPQFNNGFQQPQPQLGLGGAPLMQQPNLNMGYMQPQAAPIMMPQQGFMNNPMMPVFR